MTINLGIIGVKGKMGSSILECMSEVQDTCLSWGIISEQDSSDHPLFKKGLLDLPKTDVIIDFSKAAALEDNLSYAIETKTPFLIGTTGITSLQREKLYKASSLIPILWSANFSLGMTALIYASEILSSFLAENFTCQITEIHHIQKKDAPSGSALTLADSISKASGNLPPIESIREGSVIGKHTAFFLSPYEKISLEHEAFSRKAFAFGVLQSAKFLKGKTRGIYQVKDIFTDQKQNPY